MTDLWYGKPITRQDISDAVTRFSPALPPTEFAAFVDSIAEGWEDVQWSEALSWDMRDEWRRYLQRRET